MNATQIVYPGLKVEVFINGPCLPVGKSGPRHALHFQLKVQECRVSSCNFRAATSERPQGKNRKYLAQAWRAVLSSAVQLQLPVDGQSFWLEPRGFWRGDQDVSHAQWKASLLLHGDGLQVYPEKHQDINEDTQTLMLWAETRSIHKWNPQVIKGLKLKNCRGIEHAELWHWADSLLQNCSKSKEIIFILFIPMYSPKRLKTSYNKRHRINKVIEPLRQWEKKKEREWVRGRNGYSQTAWLWSRLPLSGISLG